jgi:hypothetical protein
VAVHLQRNFLPGVTWMASRRSDDESRIGKVNLDSSRQFDGRNLFGG